MITISTCIGVQTENEKSGRATQLELNISNGDNMNDMADQERSRRDKKINTFILKIPLCENILFNDRVTSGVQLASRHDDHFHVSIAME